MITEQNREVIYQLYNEVISRKQQDTGYRSKGNGFTQYTVSAKPSSLKAFNNFFAAINAAFPDYELTLDNLIIKGDRVMARYTVSGTHKGDFMGMAPTNKRMIISGIDIFRLDKGKVVEHWDAAHQISALPQLRRETATPPGNSNPGSLAATPSDKKQLSLSI